MLGTGLAPHELHERLKAQSLPRESLERQGFDDLVLMDDQQGTFSRREVQGHVLARQSATHVIALEINPHAAIAMH
jgi:hypothetical protein